MRNKSRSESADKENEFSAGKVLVHPDGRTVTFLENGWDDRGEFITVEHRITQPGAINGPHWHPVLEETFKVQQGRMRFLVDGQETILEAGGEITVRPKQVHQFWNISEGQHLVATHVIRPPGLHWKMFVLVHKLECEGKMSASGVPRHPLWLGVAWECIDGYLAGPPQFIQKVLLGGLAKLARKLGYRI